MSNAIGWFGFTTGGMIRAIAGISLGISLYVASEAIKRNYEVSKLGNIILRAIAFVLLALLFFFMGTAHFNSFKIITDLNFIAYTFIFLLIILITKSNLTFLDTKFTKLLSILSLPIFLNHRIWIYFIDARLSDLSDNKKLALYLGATLVTALIAIPLSKLISKCISLFYRTCFIKKQVEG